jgi:hypothetical protein
MNTNGTVAIDDFSFFVSQFARGEPGPSGLKCALADITAPNQTGKLRCWFLPTHRVLCPELEDGTRADGADHHGILTNPANDREYRYLNKRHYAHLVGPLGGHCDYHD